MSEEPEDVKPKLNLKIAHEGTSELYQRPPVFLLLTASYSLSNLDNRHHCESKGYHEIC